MQRPGTLCRAGLTRKMAVINGTSGDDTLTQNANEDDRIDGMGGVDTLDLSAMGEGARIKLSQTTEQAIGPNQGRDIVLNIENLIGTMFDDRMTGLAGGSRIEGLAGADLIYGLGGDDQLFGGDGNDRILGDEGTNHIEGGAGIDVITAKSGADTIDGGTGDDRIYSGGGDDTLTGGEGEDDLYGGDGQDTEYGGAGNDYLFGGAGHDWLDGGDDTDKIYAGTGWDVIYAGAGVDIVAGNDGNDEIYGGDDRDILRGQGDSDVIYGGAGNDDIDGGEDRDELYGGLGNDHVRGGRYGGDEIYGGEGNDTLEAGGSLSFVYGGAGDDRLFGSYSTELYGGAGRDVLYGGNHDALIFDSGEGDDTEIGGGADDWFVATPGDDRIAGNDGLDVLDLSALDHGVTITMPGAGVWVLDVGLGSDRLTDIEGLAAPDFDSVLIGDDRDNILYGGAGNDRLDGGEGSDIVVWSDGGGLDDFRDTGTIGTDTLRLVAPALDGLPYGGGAKVEFRGLPDQFDVSHGIERIEKYGTRGLDIIGSDTGVIWDFTGIESFGSFSVHGGAAADMIDGGYTRFGSLYGEGGDDTLRGIATSFYGGDGDDEMFAAVDQYNNGSDFVGGAGNDTGHGSAGRDSFYGGDGDDWFEGFGDWDYIYGGDGNDTAYGGDSDDALNGGNDDDTLYGDAGRDRLRGESGVDTLYGGDDDDELYGGYGVDTLYGGDGNDLLDAGEDGDALYGGAGDDILKPAGDGGIADGGEGSDLYYEGTYRTAGLMDTGTTGIDVLTTESGRHVNIPTLFSAANGIEEIRVAADYEYDFPLRLQASTNQTTNNEEVWDLRGISYADGTEVDMSYGNDDVIGSQADEVIYGGWADDVISGGPGDDQLIGESGLDIFRMLPGSDGETIVDFKRYSDEEKIDARAFAGLDTLADFNALAATGGNGTKLDGGDSLGAISVTQSGGTLHVNFGDGTIMHVEGFTELLASDFIFDGVQPLIINVSDLQGADGYVLLSDHYGFGHGIAGLGDVTGNGNANFAAGFLAHPDNKVLIYSGHASPQIDNVTGRAVHAYDAAFYGFTYGVEPVSPSDGLGDAAGAAGDVNGDGIDDFIVGARTAGPDGARAGEAYVFFTQALAEADDQWNGAYRPIETATLSPDEGFVIAGEFVGGTFGVTVSGGGDVNGDGFDDVIVGAPYDDTSVDEEGLAVVVFGKASGIGSLDAMGRAVVDVATLQADEGFLIIGDGARDHLGQAVEMAGDLNGDGFADLIVSADRGNDGGGDAGETYVIFGTDQGFGTVGADGHAVVDTTFLSPDQGFIIKGDRGPDRSGYDVHTAGDFNGDGFDDIIIGTYSGDDGGTNAGEAYLIFGKAGGFGTVNGTGRAVLDLSTLDPSDGFILQGSGYADRHGFAVSGGGDINGDGFDDVVIGAPFADDGAPDAGAATVIYGSDEQRGIFDGAGRLVFSLENIDQSDGFTMIGGADGGRFGEWLDILGDTDGDGFADIGLEARRDQSGVSEPHALYIIKGGLRGTDDTGLSVSGTGAADRLIGGAGDDLITDVGTGDVARTGAGDDVISLIAADVFGIDGGSGDDMVGLGGLGHVDLASLGGAGRISGVENFDMTGGGADTLDIADAMAVFALSDTTNLIDILGDAEDTVILGSDFALHSTNIFRHGMVMHSYEAGDALVVVDPQMTVILA